MKSKKTLITMALASTFGWSSAVFAGPGHSAHEVITPASPNEAGQSMAWSIPDSHSSQQASAVGTTSDHAGGSLSGSYSDSSGLTGSDESASLSMDESLALGDEGIYSDFYVATFEPTTLDGWDYYVLDTDGWQFAAIDDTEGSDQLAASDDSYLILAHDLALIPSEDEMVYELALVPTDFDDMTVEFGSGLTETFGE
jgi:hypothetical protein